jgi:hypothetical protein
VFYPWGHVQTVRAAVGVGLELYFSCTEALYRP